MHEGTHEWGATRPAPRRGRVALAVTVALLAVLGASCSSTGSTSTGDGDGAAADAMTPGTAATSGNTGGTTGPAEGAATPSAGCGSSTSTGAVLEEKRTIDVDGTERWYLITTPAGNDGTTPLPVVFDFHGLMEGAQVHAAMSAYSALAQEEGFIAVFPHGQGEPVRWDANPNNTPNADLAYFDELYASLGTDLCIDTSRIYSTGLSYGAIMTSFLMCERADHFAAVAPVAGIQTPEPCRSYEPLPILTFHGTADPILAFDGQLGDALGTILGGGGAAGAETTTTTMPDLNGEGYPAYVATWAERNGCDPEPTDVTTETGEEATPQIVRRTYTCPEGAEVEFVIIVGGGHSWPGSEFSKSIGNVVGPTTSAVDATRESWAFFQRHQRPS